MTPGRALKEYWEDQTLDYFLSGLANQRRSHYELVERRERPDRIIREVGGSQLIGVEITRIVEGADAKQRRGVIGLAGSMRDVLERYSRAGRVTLYQGSFPATTSDALRRLSERLDGEIQRAGDLTKFIKSLPRGRWRCEGAVFHFSEDDGDGWRFRNNTLRPPWAGRPSQEDLSHNLIDRVEDKIEKSLKYPWAGPLWLLVRNTYQPFEPPTNVLLELGHRLEKSVFGDAWLVNHTEGTIDADPPEPRLVRLGGAAGNRP